MKTKRKPIAVEPAGAKAKSAAAKPGSARTPSGLDIARQARRHTTAALEAFVAVMQDANAPPAARVAAATQILTWGYGKNAGGESETGERTVRLAWEG
ncbi:MAG: hypothetical protein SGJ07_15210 [Rhodospirillaceae bacterium]|nr:hypothetical protein [Rhodospirillaceae bacterium]